MKFRDFLLATIAGAGMAAGAGVASAYAQDAAVAGADPAADVEEVVVTGSRVVTNGNAAPTPVTVVTAEALMSQTPSNLPDALNKLPQFAQSTRSGQGGPSSAGGVGTANTLNLRNFGAQRNLILFNGLRVPSTTTAGEVDINVLPQMLIQKVDVVTGGASAVYGSDAVTGVVNFVVDRRFTGLKVNAHVGTSSRSDNEQWKFGIAGGADLTGDGRAHVMASYEHFDSEGIPTVRDRPNGADFWTATGSGSAANPFALTRNGRAAIYTYGGLITVGPAGLVGRDFVENGVLMPFVPGERTGSNGLQSGGGGLIFDNTLYAPLATDQAYGRFDYEFSDTFSAYADLAYARSESANKFLPLGTNGLPGANGLSGAVILSGNAFLPPSVQSVLINTGSPSFVLSRYERSDSVVGNVGNQNRTENVLGTVGFAGKLASKFDWDLGVRYGRTSQFVINTNNTNAAKLAAALDAVINPATGQVVCHVSLTPSASRFPGCVPINMFGPTAVTREAADYVSDDTTQDLITKQWIINGGISGEVFMLPAGPVVASLSGEYRDLSTKMVSDTNPLTRADCTGLRANCLPSTPAYFGYTNGAFSAEQTIKEAAVEILAPLLADLPLIRKLEFNGAARYTDYSTSGSVETWKLGLSWEVTDELRIRATRSRDIRAPNLWDLYRPGSASLFGFADLHTGVTRTVVSRSQGNPELVPEVGDTLTIGAVYRPAWLPGFSVSLDYYDIELEKAITNVAGTSPAIQRLCEDSNGTSPYCALYVRPLPFADRSPDNTATTVLSQSLNVGKLSTWGADLEVNYGFEATDLFAAAPGRVDIRFLGSYQPKLLTQPLVGGTITNGAGVNGVSKLRLNLTAAYSNDVWSVAVNQRWKSKQRAFADPIVSVIPDADAYAYTDVTVDYKLRGVAEDMVLFANVQNLFDKNPPIFGTVAGAPGLVSPYGVGYDVVGRYYTVGVRTKF